MSDIDVPAVVPSPTERVRPRGGHRRRGRATDIDGRRGQALAEFALIIPVFFLLFAGMVDFGLALYSDLTVINAAREGARLGIIEPGETSDVEARVRSMAANLDQSRLTVAVSCERPSGSSFVACVSPEWQTGDATVVQVDYRYSMIFPLLFEMELPLSAEMRMRIE